MVRAMSLFNQLPQHFPALEFAALVKKHSAETGGQRLQLQGATGRDAVLPVGSRRFAA